MKNLLLLLVLVLVGCNTQPPQARVYIHLTNDKKGLKIIGIDPVIMQDISRDTLGNWQSLFAVYRMPADTGMKNYQPIQPGQYRLADTALVFTPDTPFAPRQTYFVRYYNYAAGKSIWDYVKGEAGANKLQYTDLVFKR